MAATPTPQPTSSNKPADARDTLKARKDEVDRETGDRTPRAGTTPVATGSAARLPKPAVEALDADASDPYDNVACTD
jgi:hypothetical protein